MPLFPKTTWGAVRRWTDWPRQFRLLGRHLRYGAASFARKDSEMKVRVLAEVFRGVNTHLRSLGVDYALGYGTLLGWHREKRILPHDYDIDFIAPVEAYPAIRDSAATLPTGFTLHDTSYRHFGPKLYVSYRGWEADIYFLRTEGANLRSTEDCVNPGDVAPFPREFFYPLQSVEFLGEPTFVPAKPVDLLTLHYGYLGPNAVRDPVTRLFKPRQH
jgi:hypothetical protein